MVWNRFARLCGILLPLLPVLLAPQAAAAQRVETPVATEFGARVDDDAKMLVGIVEELPGGGPSRVGFMVVCVKEAREVLVRFSFGAYPAGKPVQAAVKHPDGRVVTIGGVEAGSPATGFHSPQTGDRGEVLGLLEFLFAHGALVSNGHNSIWNRVPEEKNREAAASIRACAGAPDEADGSLRPAVGEQPGREATAACLIKGNVSRNGSRVYHLPDGARYDRIEINESAGERWFCSEAEARAEGWVRSRR